MTQNDDELEMNWTAEGIEIADDESVISMNSEDNFHEEVELELATGIKRSRETEMTDVTIDHNEIIAMKKQKTDSTVKCPAQNPKGLHKMTELEHSKLVNDTYLLHRGGQMTLLEIADGLNESHFLAPTGLGKHKLELLPSYIHHLLPTYKREFLGKDKRRDKSPIVLILSSSALRCVEVIKHLASFQCRVAKLFGKHLKINEQVKQLTSTYFPIAVGTPARVKKLLEIKALSMKHTKRVILDMEKNKKQLSILELKDTATEVVDLLQFHLLPQLNAKQSEMKIVLF
ncbi:unnamed protein product [Peronospora belbahrii]|uniref:Uncharacterized protein n=1 Tax=Peronospora belbahrii TaxID=622444 RepID=A0AAU9KX30_9STRA|nr:unnamed protein product [Peronospora belbahrii]CAH0520314.1 unnamed protein product [Peronospora belbahrii]